MFLLDKQEKAIDWTRQQQSQHNSYTTASCASAAERRGEHVWSETSRRGAVGLRNETNEQNRRFERKRGHGEAADDPSGAVLTCHDN